MTLFFAGIVVLAIGYFLYGSIIERILEPDNRPTPAIASHDGVDYVILPTWKNMLIQLLNIAGIGPVIGVIAGIKFGEIVFVIIPVGCVLMGSVHDFVAGMCSLRNNGANIPALAEKYLPKYYFKAFNIVISLALVLVAAVFINVPAKLLANIYDISNGFFIAVVIIFLYYIIATLFPIDKIIGKIYPIFGMLLLTGTALLLFSILSKYSYYDSFMSESEGFLQHKFTAQSNAPVFPLLFVTIACGIMSGFHSTQAPLVARTLKTERHAKPTFFGMMIVEGLIAMIWAAGAMIVYNQTPDLMTENPNNVLIIIAQTFLNSSWTSMMVIISVIILAITSGDTALRSLRLSLADTFHLDQKPLAKRILVCLPLMFIIAGILFWSNKDAESFGKLWNYFALMNQCLAAFALIIGTSYLITEGKPYLATLLPGLFISIVDITYILWISPAHNGPVGFGMELKYAMIFAAAMSLIIFSDVITYANGLKGKIK